MIPANIETKIKPAQPDISPPPSPPPIHSLYTDGSIYRRTYTLPTSLPTRNNKANVKQSQWYRKRPPLLVPKPSDLPAPSTTDKDTLTRRQKIYGYMQSTAIYLMKQLLRKNNLALVINLLHQAWRARFFVARAIRTTHHTLTTFPANDVYRDMVRRMMAEQWLVQLSYQQVKQQASSLDLRQIMVLAHTYRILLWAHIMTISQHGLKTVVRAIRHFSAWDSVMMAITSVALTRSLQNPSHWM
ncbi:hypothetical protein BC941DRAFT_443224 [Chlamydoabsidia padenii]|nr:hypothetical protein BC941DRAFT_443224 [Chlamydoabsidia padenii]